MLLLNLSRISKRSFNFQNLSIRLLTNARNNADEDAYSASFGFKQIKAEEKQEKVNEVFDNVARKYDLMNDAMSVGMHRIWKNKFIREIEPNESMRLIDVAGGTGDIAFRYLNYIKNNNSSPKIQPSNENFKKNDSESDQKKVTVCDINKNMLEVGQKRALAMNLNDDIQWRLGNAEDLNLEKDNSYDVYTIAFGIRNCTHLDKVVKEAYRVLKPGGRFMCMEFSQPTSEIFNKIYDFYSFEVIPPMGYLLAQDWDSYQYLVESIRVFPRQDEFASLIKSCGFKLVSYENLTNGIVAIHTGFKL